MFAQPFARACLHIAALAVLGSLTAMAAGQETVYSGPQPGEKITPFKAIEVRGTATGRERDLITENQGAATALVFVHGVERSMVPIMTVIDQYAVERKDALKAAFVFLSADRVASEKQIPMVGQSLRLQSPMLLSLDGIEGPGNYGLNKNCLLTVVLAKDNRVTANFALVQPGIADAPKVIDALAKVIGDQSPPTAEQLRARRQATPGNAGGRPMARAGSELMNALTNTNKPDVAKQALPGAAPTDEKLVGLLRSFIQRSNDDARVDSVLQEVEAYIQGNESLSKQAVDGWTRVIYLKYGTEYARKAGQAMVDRLKK